MPWVFTNPAMRQAGSSVLNELLYDDSQLAELGGLCQRRPHRQDCSLSLNPFDHPGDIGCLILS